MTLPWRPLQEVQILALITLRVREIASASPGTLLAPCLCGAPFSRVQRRPCCVNVLSAQDLLNMPNLTTDDFLIL